MRTPFPASLGASPRHPMTARASIAALLALALSPSPLLAQTPDADAGDAATSAVAPSRIDKVTVYRGEALVTRLVELPTESGELDVVVDGLPERVVAASLVARPDGKGVLVRSVRYRSQAVAATPEPKVAALDAELAALAVERSELATAVEATELRRTLVVEQMRGWSAGAAKQDLGRGLLDPKRLAEVNAHQFGLLDKLDGELRALRERQRSAEEKQQLAQRRRREIAKGGKQARQAVISYAKATKGKATLQLDYLVSGTMWTPTYHVRLGKGGDKVRVEYLAEVRQQSGEDWSGVALVLSTATPRMSAESPVLAPLWVQLAAEGGRGGKAMGSAAYGAMQSQLRAEQRRHLADANAGAAGWEVNKAAARSQSAEIAADRDAIVNSRDTLRQAEETLAVSYAIDGRLALGSRSESQLVEVAGFELAAEAFYEAVPLFSSYVNRFARVVNTTAVPLLAGPYAAWSDGEFVGRGTIGVVATGQDFVVGFGADTQLRCGRELMDKADETSWGTRTQRFDVRLRVESFKSKPVRVILYDRIPATRDGEDLKIKLVSQGRPLSTDPVYVRDRKPAGILRWELEVAAGGSGAKALDLRYRWEMSYGKDKHLGREATERLDLMKRDYENFAH